MKVSKIIAGYLTAWIVGTILAFGVGIAINWNLFYVAFWLSCAFGVITVWVFLNPLWFGAKFAYSFVKGIHKRVSAACEVLDRAVEAATKENDDSER